jgi:anti-sigma B factor antagonist
MECVIEERDGVIVVSPRGDLDAGTTGGFQAQIDGCLRAGGQYYVIDLGGVAFVDSTGLAALVGLFRRLRIGEGDVRLAQVPPAIMRILELTHLSRVFDIFPTAAEAVASIRPSD